MLYTEIIKNGRFFSYSKRRGAFWETLYSLTLYVYCDAKLFSVVWRWKVAGEKWSRRNGMGWRRTL